MRKIEIALLTIILSFGVAMSSGVAYAAEVPGETETSGEAYAAEVPGDTESSGVAETADASVDEEEITETDTETEGSGVAETSEVTAEEEIAETDTEIAETEDTEISEAAGTAEAAVVDGPTEIDGVLVVDLNSGAERNGEFITVNEEFQTESGSLTLIMSGLKGGNKDALLNALGQYFDANGDKGVKVVDAAFADAEKWDAENEGPDSYDYGQCWAATASNMLWVSGWAGSFENPATGANFASEDEVFELFNTSFTDSGSEVSSGIDWFLMGEYYASDIGSHAVLKNTQTGGYLKTFVSTLAQHRYAMKEDDGYISQLERIDASSESPAVFQLSLGSLEEGVLSTSIHSVTIAGVIIDPQASSLENRYKGIAIVNSDDDAVPSEAAQQIADPTFEQKQADKAARPNSCTFYPLRHMYDANGTPCWEIVGFSDEETTTLYAINALELPSDDLISKYTETEGNCSASDTVDLTLESVITTKEEEPIADYWHYSIFADDYKCNEFSADEPVNLNYFVINRTKVILDTEYKGGKDLSVGWKVTKDSDGSVVAEGTSVFDEDVYSGSERGAMIHLNEQDGVLAKWEAGSYTATISLNPDRAVNEAYYLNNIDQSVQFTILASEDQDETSDSGDTSDDPTPEEKSDDSASKDTSGDPASEEKSDESASKDKSGESSSKDKSGDSASKDKSGESESKDKSGESSSKDKSGESSSKDKSGESESKDKPGGLAPGDDSGSGDSDSGDSGSGVSPGHNDKETSEASKETESGKARDDTNTGDMASDRCRDSLLLLGASVLGLLVVLRRMRVGDGG